MVMLSRSKTAALPPEMPKDIPKLPIAALRVFQLAYFSLLHEYSINHKLSNSQEIKMVTMNLCQAINSPQVTYGDNESNH